MEFLTLNFGQLLHLLDNELKNIIRNFENTPQKIISAQYGIVFNQTCLNEELYHAYPNIYIYILLKDMTYLLLTKLLFNFSNFLT